MRQHVMTVVGIYDLHMPDAEKGTVFVPLADAVRDLSVYESWSRLCLEQLDMLLAKASSASARAAA